MADDGYPSCQLFEITARNLVMQAVIFYCAQDVSV